MFFRQIEPGALSSGFFYLSSMNRIFQDSFLFVPTLKKRATTGYSERGASGAKNLTPLLMIFYNTQQFSLPVILRSPATRDDEESQSFCKRKHRRCEEFPNFKSQISNNKNKKTAADATGAMFFQRMLRKRNNPNFRRDLFQIMSPRPALRSQTRSGSPSTHPLEPVDRARFPLVP